MKKSDAKLKKKLDAVFSLYIRHKYAQDGMVRCYTCSVSKPIKEIQNGHFVPRNILATRFLEDNCRPQCVGCNMFQRGRPDEFAAKLEREEKGTVERLNSYRYQAPIKYFPYEEKIEYYTQELKKLST